jgi:hypothetical protein
MAESKPLVDKDAATAKTMANIKLGLSFGIVFGIGLISGWYLTASGFFG